MACCLIHGAHVRIVFGEGGGVAIRSHGVEPWVHAGRNGETRQRTRLLRYPLHDLHDGLDYDDLNRDVGDVLHAHVMRAVCRAGRSTAVPVVAEKPSGWDPLSSPANARAPRIP